jgi:lipopolysaccharide transport system permease protein
MKKKYQMYAYLVKELTIREIRSKYKGSIFGIFWSLLTPIAMLFVFTFVFGGIFKAKWPGIEVGTGIDFAVNLYIGLSIFWFFADIIGKAPNLIVSTPNFVKKVIFPLEILPLVSLLASFFHLVINILLILVALLLTKGSITFYIFLLPIVIGVTFPLLLGIGLFLGSLGVYVRDISSLISVFINFLMFLSPVFYPLSAIPQNLQWLFELNPITLIIESSRNILIHNTAPDFAKLGVYFIISSLCFLIGHKVFYATRKGFADVI